MKSKKLPLITFILSTVFMMSCTAGGSVTTPIGSVSASATLHLAFAGTFTATVAGSNATGDGDLNISQDQKSCNVDAHFQNLSSDETSAEIDSDDPSMPVIAPLPVGQVNNVTINLTNEQVNIINENKAYINIHTKNHPEGELRCRLNKK